MSKIVLIPLYFFHIAILTDPRKPPIPEKPSIRTATKTKTHPTDDGSRPETKGKSSRFPPKKTQSFSSKWFVFHTQMAGTGTDMPILNLTKRNNARNKTRC